MFVTSGYIVLNGCSLVYCRVKRQMGQAKTTQGKGKVDQVLPTVSTASQLLFYSYANSTAEITSTASSRTTSPLQVQFWPRSVGCFTSRVSFL